jgi:hypothetical protein
MITRVKRFLTFLFAHPPFAILIVLGAISVAVRLLLMLR